MRCPGVRFGSSIARTPSWPKLARLGAEACIFRRVGDPIADIEWRESLDEAISLATQARKLIVLKPLGQGLLTEQHW